jgi:hypothetical protein
MHDAGSAAALVKLCLAGRLQVDVGRDQLLGMVDRGAAFEPDADQQHMGIVGAREPVRAVG